MGVDYYKALQVDRNTKDDDLKKEIEAKFKLISKAYEVLRDPQKRAVYDQYGEEGLKGQVPPPGSCCGGSMGGSSFGGRDGSTAFRFNPKSGDDIYSEFFGFSSPIGGGSGPAAGGGRDGSTAFRLNPKSHDDIYSEFFGSSSPIGGGSDPAAGARMRGGSRFSGGDFTDDIFGSQFGGEASMNPHRPQKAEPIENRLPCSLEDLCKGTTKKMKISREVSDTSGKTMTVEEILTINIKPGWKKGTKITFSEKGNEAPNIIPADITFIVDEKPHDVYAREGNDLIVVQKISLVEALTGYSVHLKTLDGRSLTIPASSVIHPSYEEVVSKEGMPIPKDPSKKGNLRIKFNIKFPTRLTAEQKAGLKQLLSP